MCILFSFLMISGGKSADCNLHASFLERVNSNGALRGHAFVCKQS